MIIAPSIFLLYFLNDSYCNSLSQVSDGKSSQRRIFRKYFTTHFFLRSQNNQSWISVFQSFGVFFSGNSSPSVNFCSYFLKFAGNVRSMAIYNWSIALFNDAGMVNDNDLGNKTLSNFWRVFLGVSGNITSLNLICFYLHIESNILSWFSFLNLFMMHFNWLDLAFLVSRCELYSHFSLQNSCFNSSNCNSSKPANLVNIIDGNPQWLLNWPFWDFLKINSLSYGRSIIPRHIGRFLNQILSSPTRNRDEGDILGFIAYFFQETADLVFDLIVSIFRIFYTISIHFIDADNQLFDSQSVSQQ